MRGSIKCSFDTRTALTYCSLPPTLLDRDTHSRASAFNAIACRSSVTRRNPVTDDRSRRLKLRRPPRDLALAVEPAAISRFLSSPPGLSTYLQNARAEPSFPLSQPRNGRAHRCVVP